MTAPATTPTAFRALDQLQARLDNAIASRDEARATIRHLNATITSVLDQHDEAAAEAEQLREENTGLLARIAELELQS